MSDEINWDKVPKERYGSNMSPELKEELLEEIEERKRLISLGHDNEGVQFNIQKWRAERQQSVPVNQPEQTTEDHEQ